MSKDQDRIKAIDRLYDAVAASDLWPDILHDLARSVDAVGGCIVMDGTSGTLIAPPVSPDIAAPLEDFVKSGWHLRDLRGQRGWPLARGGRRVLLEHDVSTEEERKRGVYHNEWLRPWDLPWWASVGFSFEGRLCGLSFLRNSRQGAFTRQEARRLGNLQPHLQRAMELSWHVSLRQAEAVLDILELINRPAFLLGTRGRVDRLNPKAEALIGEHFTLCRGILRAAGRENDTRLQRLISAALASAFPSAAPEERPIAIRWAGRKPLIVRALPAIGLMSEVFSGARALLLVSDLDVLPTLPADALPSMFGLTRTEALLAGQLAAGSDLSEAAEALRISTGTARNHLKAIFAKTETRRQSELISLIRRIGAA